MKLYNIFKIINLILKVSINIWLTDNFIFIVFLLFFIIVFIFLYAYNFVLKAYIRIDCHFNFRRMEYLIPSLLLILVLCLSYIFR